MSTNNQIPFGSISLATPAHAAPLEQGPIDPNSPGWGLGGALVVLIGSLLLQAVLSIVFLLPYSLQRGLNPSSPEFGKNLIAFALSDRIAILLQVISLLPAHLLTLVLIWAVVTRFGKRPFLAALGLHWSNVLEFWISAALGIFLFLVASALAWWLGTDKPTPLEQIINSSLAARYSIAALAVFTAPLVEELVYRGVLYSALQKLVGPVGGAIIVLALFTMIHVPQYRPNYGVIAAVGLLSICLTIIRAYTGRLFPCFIIHLVFNGIQSALLLFEPHAQRLVPVDDRVTSIVFILTRLARLVIWP